MKLRWCLGLFFIYPLAKLILGLKVLGREKLSLTGGKIIAANHTSNLDPFILGLAAGQEIFFLAKEELFNFRKWFGWLIRTWNALPVKRGTPDPGLFKTCSSLLQKNQTLIMFPEGTRSKNGNLLPFKTGVSLLAVINSVPVIPCYIYGVRDSFISKIVDPDINHSKIKIGDFFTSRILIKFGNPIAPAGFGKNRNDYENFADKIKFAVEVLAKIKQ